jgi:hypothetical protein
VGFLLPIQAAGARAVLRTTCEGRVQPLLRKHASHPAQGGRTHLQGFADLVIGPAWAVFSGVCLQHDPRMQQSTGGHCASGDEMLQVLALCLGQAYDILFHEGLLERLL